MRMWQIIRASTLGRHVHKEGYAALVLSGGYEEAGDGGRFQVSAGNVVFHEPFEAHLNRVSASGAVVLNLPLPRNRSYAPGIAKVADPDLVARAAKKSCDDAVDLLVTTSMGDARQPADWPDELAAALLRNPSLKLSRWGERNGIAPWTVSRGFALVFGVSPEAFRVRARARQAWNLIRNTREPLAAIAAELGFADQSHMTRSVKHLTASAPQAWRSGK